MEQVVLCEEVDAFVIEERACIRCDLCQEQEQTREYRSKNIEKRELFDIYLHCWLEYSLSGALFTTLLEKIAMIFDAELKCHELRQCFVVVLDLLEPFLLRYTVFLVVCTAHLGQSHQAFGH